MSIGSTPSSRSDTARQKGRSALARSGRIGQPGRMRLIVELPVRASRSEVWAAISSVDGVNREVSPFVRMTDSTHGAHFDTEPWRVGTPVLWQLLFGFIPVDRHRVELVALPDEGGFRESSSSWWHRVWRHERT